MVIQRVQRLYRTICIELIVMFMLISTPVIAAAPTSTEADIFTHMVLMPSTYDDLPGWQKDDQSQALAAFQHSCQVLLSTPSNQPLGSASVPMTRSDWKAACQAAIAVQSLNTVQARAFFEKWFQPFAVFNQQDPMGKFTGYYLPQTPGSLQKTKQYSAPIYARPHDLITVKLDDFSPSLTGHTLFGKVEGQHLKPYNLPRSAINRGALMGRANILAWTTPIDRFYLQVQGSGMIALDKGGQILLGYDGENGSRYLALGKLFVEKGIFTVKEATMQRIRQWMAAHPKQAPDLLNQNESFVFFQRLPGDSPLGTQHVPITAGRTLAVDQVFIPLGLPIWLSTSTPAIKQPAQTKILQRLLIAQDTGGAIRGIVRGDVYWGAGKQAASIAGRMNSQGRYWLLMPRTWQKK